ncbi:hypothetical protein IAT38_004452 [Cryptococcus sp. DSM 104549]
MPPPKPPAVPTDKKGQPVPNPVAHMRTAALWKSFAKAMGRPINGFKPRKSPLTLRDFEAFIDWWASLMKKQGGVPTVSLVAAVASIFLSAYTRSSQVEFVEGTLKEKLGLLDVTSNPTAGPSGPMSLIEVAWSSKVPWKHPREDLELWITLDDKDDYVERAKVTLKTKKITLKTKKGGRSSADRSKRLLLTPNSVMGQDPAVHLLALGFEDGVFKDIESVDQVYLAGKQVIKKAGRLELIIAPEKRDLPVFRELEFSRGEWNVHEIKPISRRSMNGALERVRRAAGAHEYPRLDFPWRTAADKLDTVKESMQALKMTLGRTPGSRAFMAKHGVIPSDAHGSQNHRSVTWVNNAAALALNRRFGLLGDEDDDEGALEFDWEVEELGLDQLGSALEDVPEADDIDPVNINPKFPSEDVPPSPGAPSWDELLFADPPVCSRPDIIAALCTDLYPASTTEDSRQDEQQEEEELWAEMLMCALEDMPEADHTDPANIDPDFPGKDVSTIPGGLTWAELLFADPPVCSRLDILNALCADLSTASTDWQSERPAAALAGAGPRDVEPLGQIERQRLVQNEHLVNGAGHEDPGARALVEDGTEDEGGAVRGGVDRVADFATLYDLGKSWPTV